MHKKAKHDFVPYLNRRVEDLVQTTCCPAVPQPSLQYGCGSTLKIPKLISWKCVSGTCNDCGVDRNLRMMECPILSSCPHKIRCIEWKDVPRQGNKRDGTPNTQLEVSISNREVRDIVSKLRKQLQVCRHHQVNYQWRNTMRNIDCTMSDPEKDRIICTDFGATLDLRGAEADNCSVDNHAVVCIFFVLMNWRKVQYKRKNDQKELVDNSTILNDCQKWAFFGSTLSRGKKNDHVFHEACITYICKYYDAERIEEGKERIPVKTVWIDQCPTQYKCRQNFRNVATSSQRIRDSIRIHKFGAKYRFKGSWDAFSKVIKERIMVNRMVPSARSSSVAITVNS